MSTKTRMFKMVNNDYIIGNVSDENITETTTAIESPLTIGFEPQQQSGKLGITLYPQNIFGNFKTEVIKFKNIHIMFEVAEIEDGIIQLYIKQTSGITLAKMPPIRFDPNANS